MGTDDTVAIIPQHPNPRKTTMDPNWQRLLAAHGARFDAEAVRDFGDARAERSTAATGTVMAPLSAFRLIRASGEDAVAFLHNLLSNDIKQLAPGAAMRCGLCSPKGRLLADFLVWRDGEDCLLQLSADLQPAILKRLGMYVLRSKVRLASADADLVLIGVSGPDAGALIRSLGAEPPAAALGVTHFGNGSIIRLDEGRFQMVLRATAAIAAWGPLAASAKPVGEPVWRWLDIAAGIPRITATTQEEFVPQMANFDLIGGVSFSKGCYPGQEVVARTRYLGKIKRRTYRARVDAACPAAGTDLYSPDLPGQSCGKVIEAAPGPAEGCELLASMLTSSAERNDVHVGSADGPLLAFLPLPYSLA